MVQSSGYGSNAEDTVTARTHPVASQPSSKFAPFIDHRSGFRRLAELALLLLAVAGSACIPESELDESVSPLQNGRNAPSREIGNASQPGREIGNASQPGREIGNASQPMRYDNPQPVHSTPSPVTPPTRAPQAAQRPSSSGPCVPCGSYTPGYTCTADSHSLAFCTGVEGCLTVIACPKGCEPASDDKPDSDHCR
jgi:hypothetical protein